MMGSCAFLMPVGSLRFIREDAYSLRNAMGLAIGGLPGVLIAAYFVKSLNLHTVRWLVIVVVLYTAITMLIAASSEKAAEVDVRSRVRTRHGAHEDARRLSLGRPPHSRLGRRRNEAAERPLRAARPLRASVRLRASCRIRDSAASEWSLPRRTRPAWSA